MRRRHPPAAVTQAVPSAAIPKTRASPRVSQPRALRGLALAISSPGTTRITVRSSCLGDAAESAGELPAAARTATAAAAVDQATAAAAAGRPDGLMVGVWATAAG